LFAFAVANILILYMYKIKSSPQPFAVFPLSWGEGQRRGDKKIPLLSEQDFNTNNQLPIFHAPAALLRRGDKGERWLTQ
jgi:hypothetical protein